MLNVVTCLDCSRLARQDRDWMAAVPKLRGHPALLQS